MIYAPNACVVLDRSLTRQLDRHTPLVQGVEKAYRRRRELWSTLEMLDYGMLDNLSSRFYTKEKK